VLFELNANPLWFPAPSFAMSDPNGLLAVGGDLSPKRLAAAYQQGIFPWYSAEDPLLWWSPDPRTAFFPETIHCSRSMARFIRRTALTVTLNHAFNEVIQSCADVHQRANRGVWIHPEMVVAYTELHHQGQAQSVEVWHQQQLVAGMYGVNVGGIFCAESMFQRETNASKLALLIFARHFFNAGGRLIDAQIANEHTSSLGARRLSRQQYLTMLADDETMFSNDFWSPRKLSTEV
jgi:leucyl/phenylalanyl-tRNA---protein transferase